MMIKFLVSGCFILVSAQVSASFQEIIKQRADDVLHHVRMPKAAMKNQKNIEDSFIKLALTEIIYLCQKKERDKQYVITEKLKFHNTTTRQPYSEPMAFAQLVHCEKIRYFNSQV